MDKVVDEMILFGFKESHADIPADSSLPALNHPHWTHQTI